MPPRAASLGCRIAGMRAVEEEPEDRPEHDGVRDEREWLKRRRSAILCRMNIPACPHCGSASEVRKWGHNRAGTQRYRCLVCQRNFTPSPKEQGHGVAIHEQAVRLYLEGMSLRAISRLLGVVHQSVANWVAAAARQLPRHLSDPTPAKTIEVDELYTFVEAKKGKSLS